MVEKERDINDRIKIYTNASKRIQERMAKSVSKGQFQFVPRDLELWMALLENSHRDIEASINPEKKSKNLIKFEIQVRKSLDDMQDHKIRAPLDQHEAFDACLSQAETIRKKFVEIIFPGLVFKLLVRGVPGGLQAGEIEMLHQRGAEFIRSAYLIEHPVTVLPSFKRVEGGIEPVCLLQKPELHLGQRCR